MLKRHYKKGAWKDLLGESKYWIRQEFSNLLKKTFTWSLVANQHTVKDSLRFADWVKKYKHSNGIMCPLDVFCYYSQMSHQMKQYRFVWTKCILRLILRRYIWFIYGWVFTCKCAHRLLRQSTGTLSTYLKLHLSQASLCATLYFIVYCLFWLGSAVGLYNRYFMSP